MSWAAQLALAILMLAPAAHPFVPVEFFPSEALWWLHVVPVAVPVHDSGQRRDSRTRLILERDLQNALERGELYFDYQPIVRAEETGLIVPVGDFACVEACKTLALDEFGTGYPSLSYLHRYALSYLKIDRTFVHGLGTNRRNLTILRAVQALSAQLGYETVAEGGRDGPGGRPDPAPGVRLHPGLPRGPAHGRVPGRVPPGRRGRRSSRSCPTRRPPGGEGAE